PSAYKAADADVLIFDRWLPAQAPLHPSLCIAPPSSAWLGRSAAEELAPSWVQSSAHPILDGVDPLTLDIARGRRYEAPALSALAVSERGTPLVSVLDSAATRAVVL